MSSINNLLSRAVFTSAGIGAVLFASVSTAAADHRYHNHGWKDRKVVVIHKHHRDSRRYHRGKRVVHVYHRHDRPKRRVKVIHHHYEPKRRVKVIHHHHRPKRQVRVIHHHHHGARSAPDYRISNQTGGTIIGGLIGAVAGSQIGNGRGRVAAVIGGTVIGAVIGGQVGKSMDHADHRQVQHTLEHARTGQPISWQNPDSGSRYTVTPTRTYRSGSLPCREYEAWVFIGGYEQKVNGIACRQPDGSWRNQAI